MMFHADKREPLKDKDTDEVSSIGEGQPMQFMDEQPVRRSPDESENYEQPAQREQSEENRQRSELEQAQKRSEQHQGTGQEHLYRGVSEQVPFSYPTAPASHQPDQN